MGSVYTMKGAGIIRVRAYGLGGGWRDVGNCSEIDIGLAEDKKTLKNFRTPGGGNYKVATVNGDMTLSLTMSDFYAANLALALKGSTTAVAAGSATDEQHKGDWGLEIAVDYQVGISSVVVKDVTGVTTYTEGTDYTLQPDGSILILSTGTIGDGDMLKISYSYVAHNRVEALTESGSDLEVKFVGYNTAEADKPITVIFHKVRFGVSDKYPLITEDFNKLTVKGELQLDETITGAGLSQFFKVQQAEA